MCVVYYHYLGHATSKNHSLMSNNFRGFFFFREKKQKKRRKGLIMLIHYLSEYDIQGRLFALGFFF